MRSGTPPTKATRTKLMTSPATIHPMVPNTRISGNCFSWSAMWWKARELASPSVGM